MKAEEAAQVLQAVEADNPRTDQILIDCESATERDVFESWARQLLEKGFVKSVTTDKASGDNWITVKFCIPPHLDKSKITGG